MHAVVRTYSGSGASELFDLIGQRHEDVEELMGEIPGFVSYAAFRTGDGAVTVTVCNDKTGTDASSLRAAQWVKDNFTGEVGPPAVAQGETVVHYNA